MLCPKCNTEIPEGYLYCPDCGEEIIIVTDFDINIEDNIDTTVFSKTTEIPDVKNKDRQIKQLTDTDDDKITGEIDLSELDNRKKTDDVSAISRIPKRYWFLSGIVCIAVIIITAFVVNIVRDFTSFDVQYSNAKQYFDNGNYDDALKTAKRAVSLSNSEVKGYVLMADIYSAQSNYDAAIAALMKALDYNPGLFSIYDRIIKCYESQGDYESIQSLLINSQDETLMQRYPVYFPDSPKFSLTGGNYVMPDPIILTANGEGVIYYTVDGTEPNQDSFIYSAPIPLEEGETTVTAIFVNNKGLLSKSSSETYTIESNVPDVPRVITASGTYNVPNPIGVQETVGIKYYYKEGTETPTEEDNLYELPLFMPLGRSEYTFVAQNEAGTYSEGVTVTYELSFAAKIDKSVAEYAISYHLLATGDTTFGYGYSCNSGYNKDGVPFYIVYEMNGNSRTGRIFAVDANTGSLYKVSADKENKTYNFTPL